MRTSRFVITLALLPLLAALGCVSGAPSPTPAAPASPATDPTPTESVSGSITVYSGRSQELVGELIEQFKADTGITVNVRYGDTAELAVLLTEEGANTPADVFFAQDAGALGAVAQAEMLASLPADLLERVPAALRSPADLWVGISGRARVLAYDSRELDAAELPESVDELTAPEWRGRIGWAPTNGSFQAFVTAYRRLRGDDAARDWLEGMLANEPRRYEGNTPIVQAIADAEIDVGLVNHYYALRQRAEQGAGFPVENHFFPGTDAGALINVAGVGILSASDDQAAARRFIEYLLSEHAQQYFANETYEYPLAEGVPLSPDIPPLTSLQPPTMDLSRLDDLEGTLKLLQDVGVLP